LISFITPAHNEEFLIGETLAILRASAESLKRPFEIIVAADACTDRTAAIAREQGAIVIEIDRRQIAAVRNAGAKIARGDIFVFVDADTHVQPETLQAAMRALDGGAVGGGGRLRVDEASPRWGRWTFRLISSTIRLMRWSAGCFFFVRRDAFDAVGGFDERYFITEEIVLSKALKKRGRMEIVGPPVITSGRKTRMYSMGEFSKLLWHFAILGDDYLQKREHFGIWYDGKREQ
jgi:glycosyltransferase involved in cell wall biosynthesis